MKTAARDGEAPRPPDLFISYSRKDKEFVRRLDEALQTRGREAWVDWEGIRPTEEFMQAIYGAIEGADTFVFVLTPDSVASAVCAREIAHAALALLEVDEAGFDKMDRAILLSIIEKFNGGPVGVETIAAAIGEEKSTIEDVYEPYLLQEGFLQRTPRGRMATLQAYRHFGITRPGGGGQGELF